MQKYNFRYYSLAYGAAFYDRFLEKNADIAKIGNPAITPSFTFSWNYPVILDIERKTVYYHAHFGHRNSANESVFQEYMTEIKDGSSQGSRHFLFADNVLLGTDKFIYLENWADQPRPTRGKLSDFLYAIVAYVEKDMMKYYIYTMRTDMGARLLETYMGSFIGSQSDYDKYGVKVISKILSQTFVNNYMNEDDLESEFRQFTHRNLSDYRLKSFFEHYPIRSGS